MAPESANRANRSTDLSSRLFGETDHAALLAVAVAAVIALAIVPGPWVLFSTLIGLTLLGIIVVYYRPVWPEPRAGKARQFWTAVKCAAVLGGVVGLCVSLALGYLLQEIPLTSADKDNCWPQVTDGLRAASPPPGASLSPGASFRVVLPDKLPKSDKEWAKVVPPEVKDRYENCVAGAASSRLPLVWFCSVVFVVIAYMVWWKRRTLAHPNGGGLASVAEPAGGTGAAADSVGGVEPPGARNDLLLAEQIMDNSAGGLLFATQTVGQVKAALSETDRKRWGKVVDLLDKAEDLMVRRQLKAARLLLEAARVLLEEGEDRVGLRESEAAQPA